MWFGVDLAQDRMAGPLAGLAFLLVAFGGALPVAALPDQIKSYAVVHRDGSLTVQGRRIRLFGIFLPSTDRVCDSRLRPVRCGSRVAAALRIKITGFVDCRPQFAYNDGSVAAVCFTGRRFGEPGDDLGAFLIEEGLALAGPDAPFEYRALERIAESQGRGVWGGFVDRIR
ncbi:MAG: hypothetical protein R3349_09200 [Geminicoccaceae bacterium]|nr:hypothetical protein [Geminicoccaceae bacterium]